MDQITFIVVADKTGGGFHAWAEDVEAVGRIEAHGYTWEQLLHSIRWNVEAAVKDVEQRPETIRLRVEQEVVVPLIDDGPIPLARAVGGGDAEYSATAALSYYRVDPRVHRKRRENRLLAFALLLVWLPILAFFAYVGYLLAADVIL